MCILSVIVFIDCLTLVYRVNTLNKTNRKKTDYLPPAVRFDQFVILLVALSYSQGAEILSDEIGKKISYIDIPEEDARCWNRWLAC